VRNAQLCKFPAHEPEVSNILCLRWHSRTWWFEALHREIGATVDLDKSLGVCFDVIQNISQKLGGQLMNAMWLFLVFHFGGILTLDDWECVASWTWASTPIIEEIKEDEEKERKIPHKLRCSGVVGLETWSGDDRS
jgi:hypothetical protein